MPSFFDDLPKECTFCGNSSVDKSNFQIVVSVDGEGTERRNGICDDCVRTNIMELAGRNREKFEEIVREARDWKPG